MTGGIDKGFCLSYWRLSYRRKLIRTIWLGVLATPLVLLVQISGGLPQVLRGFFELRHPVGVGWAIVFASLLLTIFQGWYNYYRWKQESRVNDSEAPPRRNS